MIIFKNSKIQKFQIFEMKTKYERKRRYPFNAE